MPSSEGNIIIKGSYLSSCLLNWPIHTGTSQEAVVFTDVLTSFNSLIVGCYDPVPARFLFALDFLHPRACFFPPLTFSSCSVVPVCVRLHHSGRSSKVNALWPVILDKHHISVLTKTFHDTARTKLEFIYFVS